MRNQVLGERYRILDRIGEGGMAYVYLAVDEKLGRKVAIKVLHEHMERNPDIRHRFQLEAQAISTLEHPNIVKIYDFAGDQAERMWIVTEVIRGKNLAQYLQQFTGGWLHPVIAACIVREILKALEKAHSHHIVHRDIKPENVMLTVEGRVKLMDFGIAKDLGKAGMTVTGTFMGSPSYMSPEQIRGRDVDLRSDLYSLSVLFYEVVTGRLPFTGQTTHDVVMKIMEGGFTHPRYVVPSLPETLNDLIVKGMAKDPRARFQVARDYGEALDELLKRLDFDESHVELERYVRDRQGYEARLAKTRPGLYSGNSLAQKLRRDTQATISLRPADAERNRAKGRTSHGQATRAEAAAGRPFKVEETWPKHFPAPRPAPPSETRPQRMPPPPRRGTPAPAAAGAVASAMRTRHGTQMQPAVPALAATPAAPAVDASTARRQAGLPLRPAPRLAAARARPPRRLPRYTLVRRSWASQVFGVALVGLIAVVSIWGFWELQARLTSGRSRGPAGQPGATATASGGRPYAGRHGVKRNGTPPTQRPVARKPAHDEAPGAPPPAHRAPLTPAKGVAASPGPQPTPAAGRHPKKAPAKPEVVLLPSDPPVSQGVTVRSAELRLAKHAVPVSAPGDVDEAGTAPDDDQPAPGPAKPPGKTAAEDEGASEPPPPDKAGKAGAAPAGKGRVSVSSQPAAEVVVDGRRVGTTVDNISDSGWLTLAAGKHALELRRQGYAPAQRRFELAKDEQKALGRVVLEPLGAGGAGAAGGAALATALTLRVSSVPAQVTIRSLDNNTTQAFTMKTPTKVVPLPAGRYDVKIEHNGELKERELSLTLVQGQLTFSADFKEGE